MSAAQSEAEEHIDAAIGEEVHKLIVDAAVRRSATQYLVGARKELPPEERTSALIDKILDNLDEEGV